MFNRSGIIAKANDKTIRLFTAATAYAEQPQWDFTNGTCGWTRNSTCNQWEVSTAASADLFSAIGFTTALYWRELYQTKGYTGIIFSAVGGTPIEDWMPHAAFSQCPSTNDEAEVSAELLPRRPTPWLGAEEHHTIAPGKDAALFRKLTGRSSLDASAGNGPLRTAAHEARVLPHVSIGDTDAAAQESRAISTELAGDPNS